MIGFYANPDNDSDFDTTSVVKKLLTVGETRSANEIAEVKFQSKRLSSDSIDSKSDFNEALSDVSSDMKKFKGISREGREDYLVKKGKKKLSPKLKRDIAKMSRDRDRLYKTRMSYIQKQLSYCQITICGFVKN